MDVNKGWIQSVSYINKYVDFCFQGHIEAVPLYACMAKRTVGEFTKTAFASTLICVAVNSSTSYFSPLCVLRNDLWPQSQHRSAPRRLTVPSPSTHKHSFWGLSTRWGKSAKFMKHWGCVMHVHSGFQVFCLVKPRDNDLSRKHNFHTPIQAAQTFGNQAIHFWNSQNSQVRKGIGHLLWHRTILPEWPTFAEHCWRFGFLTKTNMGGPFPVDLRTRQPRLEWKPDYIICWWWISTWFGNCLFWNLPPVDLTPVLTLV